VRKQIPTLEPCPQVRSCHDSHHTEIQGLPIFTTSLKHFKLTAAVILDGMSCPFISKSSIKSVTSDNDLTVHEIHIMKYDTE
jgi:hypothetical protein